MTKKGYIFRLDWSQTEHEMIVVYAHSREEAEECAEFLDERSDHDNFVAKVAPFLGKPKT